MIYILYLNSMEIEKLFRLYGTSHTYIRILLTFYSIYKIVKCKWNFYLFGMCLMYA